MTDGLDVRPTTNQDRDALERLYPLAIPDEDLLPLVHSLVGDTNGITSLTATLGPEVAGHVVFSKCGIAGSEIDAALLGPLAVAPKFQKQGVGSSIVRAGLRLLKENGVHWVLVLGDPAYYGRFGFAAETRVEPPFPLPAEWHGAWQSLPLESTGTAPSGALVVPPQWRQSSLWAP